MNTSNTTTDKKTGKSFNRLSNQWNLKPQDKERKYVQLGNERLTTAAQLMTRIAYGDNNRNPLPVRNLDFKAACENYQDFAKCIEIIHSYNEFDSTLILKKAVWLLNLRHFLNEDNGNNGGSFFDFEIAREGSPAFYVSLNPAFHNKIITDTEEIEATETTEAHTDIFWEEYTVEDFKRNMQLLADQIKADEFSIEEGYKITARFWFD